MQKHTVSMLEHRKHLLEQRTDRDNYGIIKKLERQIRRMKEHE